MTYVPRFGEPAAICDRCGFKFQHGQLRKEWTGFMVCSPCWDPKHPQLSIRGVPDHQGIRPNMRPEPADQFIEPTATTADDL